MTTLVLADYLRDLAVRLPRPEPKWTCDEHGHWKQITVTRCKDGRGWIETTINTMETNDAS